MTEPANRPPTLLPLLRALYRYVRELMDGAMHGRLPKALWASVLAGLLVMGLTTFESSVYRAGGILDLAQTSGVVSAQLGLISEEAVARNALEASGRKITPADFPPPGPPYVGSLIHWVWGGNDVVDRFREATDVQLVDSGLVHVSVSTHDPELSQLLANRTLEAAQRSAAERRSRAVEQRMTETRQELAAQDRRVRDAQMALAKHWESSPTVEREAHRALRIEQLESDHIAAHRERVSLEGNVRALETMAPSSAPAAQDNPALARMFEEQAKLELLIAQLRTQYKADYPELRRSIGRLARLETQIAREHERVAEGVRGEYQEALEREESLRIAIEEERRDAARSQQVDAIGAQLQARLELERELLAAIKDRTERNFETRPDTLSVPRILELAAFPSQPSGPRPLQRGIFTAGSLSLFFILVRAYRAARRRGRHGAAIELTSYTEVVAEDPDVPLLPSPGRWLLPREAGAPIPEQASLAPGSSPAFELPEGLRGSLVLTSARPREGKTTMAVRVAESLARQGARVILVDGDRRQAAIHRTLGVRESPGVLEVLAGKVNVRDATQQSLTPNLYVLSAGRGAFSSERFLSSAEMQTLVRSLERDFDHVIIDAPPLDACPDTAVLGAAATGVVLVVNRCVVGPKEVQSVRERLQAAGARIVGAVCNDIDPGDALFFARHVNYFGNYESHAFEEQEAPTPKAKPFDPPPRSNFRQS